MPATLDRLAATLGVQTIDLLVEGQPPTLVHDREELVKANLKIVESARSFLYAAGSRSHDEGYLGTILEALRSKPDVIHRRILFGPPRTAQLHSHILALISLRDPETAFVQHQRSLGIAIHSSKRTFPMEASIVMNEKEALYVLPSINSPWGYDTAVVIRSRLAVEGWRKWLDGIFETAQRVRSPTDLPPWSAED